MNIQTVQTNLEYLSNLSLDDKISEINKIKTLLSQYSPFKSHPVDNVIWIKAGDNLQANDYNPNSQADVEHKLLELSLIADGFTQPVVTMPIKKDFEIVDGFHRSKLAKESDKIKETTFGYVPIVQISRKLDKESRLSTTVRHNRARGTHAIQGMSKIVQDLQRRGWSEEKIGKELGMQKDEVLRLQQTLGLSELYENQEYSFSWNPSDV